MLELKSHRRPRRIGHEKSKNGCLTCKIRKVKCDETRPYCRRCTETGRKCEGPVVRQFQFIHDRPVSRSTTPVLQSEALLLVPQHDEYERRAFQFFIRHAAPFFAETIDARFTTDLVPCLAQTYDFVWDVVVATGTLAEHVPYMSLSSTFESRDLNKVTNREHRRALRLYNRSISSVRHMVERNQIDSSILALSYILFAGLEFAQRNVKTGQNLIKKGCQLLTDDLTSHNTRPESIAGQTVHQVLAPFVLRKGITGLILENALYLQQADQGEISDPLLIEAIAQFSGLIGHWHEVFRHADFMHKLTDENPDKVFFSSERKSALDKLTQWKTSFIETRSQHLDSESDYLGSYMLMYWAVSYISLESCTCLYETIFDDYMDHFADIIRHANICIRFPAGFKKLVLLSRSENRVIPALYFCGTKCRDPIIRREALRLMCQMPQQENHGIMVAPDRVVDRIISIEERDCQLSCSDGFPQLQSAILPAEECRFAYISVLNRQAPGGKRCLTLELSRWDINTDGSRKLIHDYTWLDEG